jgi:hypothetical protein
MRIWFRNTAKSKKTLFIQHVNIESPLEMGQLGRQCTYDIPHMGFFLLRENQYLVM